MAWIFATAMGIASSLDPRNAPMRWAFLASTGLVLLVGLAALGWLTLPLPLRLSGAFIGLGLLPGCVLLGCWRRTRLTIGEWLAYGFGLSLALFAGVVIPAMLWEWNTGTTTAGCLLASVGLGLLGVWRGASRWLPGPESTRLTAFLWLGLLLVLATLLLHQPPLTTDELYSLAEIRKLAEFETLSPREAVYWEAPPDPVYAFNVWDAFLALVTRGALADAIESFLFLPLLLSPLLLLATVLVSRAIFRDNGIARWCGVAFLLTFGVLEACWIFQSATYHVIVANLILGNLAVAAALEAAHGRRGFAAISATCAAVAATVHLFSLILYGLALGGTWVFGLLARPPETRWTRSLLMCLLGTTLLLLPYVVLKAHYYQIAELASDFSQPWHPIQLTDHFYVENPDLFFAPHYYSRYPFSPRAFMILAYAALPLLFFLPMARRARLYLIATTSIPLLTSMNPFLYPLLGRLLTFVAARRFTQLAPAVQTEGLLLARLFEWARGRHPAVGVGLVLLIVAGLMAGSREARDALNRTGPNPSLSIWKVEFEVNPYRKDFMKDPGRALPMLRFLRDAVPEPTVIAADLNAGLLALAFTRHFILATHGQQSSMGVADQPEREALLAAIYDMTPVSEIRDALRRYGVRYILYDHRRPDGVGSPGSAEKFTGGDGRIVYTDAEYLVIELSP